MEILTKDALVGALNVIKDREATIAKHEAMINVLNTQIENLNGTHSAEKRANQGLIADQKVLIEKLQPAYNLVNDPDLVKSYAAIQPPPIPVIVPVVASTPASIIKTESSSFVPATITPSVVVLPPISTTPAPLDTAESFLTKPTFMNEVRKLWSEIVAAWERFRHPSSSV